jgi:hypothetical protein|tara:strand:- start:18961 stop:19521 length:561 start_codon:yes stop_codon:yes gene_type:complete
MSQFEDVANKLNSVDEKGLSEVSKLCQKQVNLQEQVDSLEEQLKETKRQLKEVAEDQLPAAMAEHNLTKLELEDGSAINVKKFYSASIPTDRKDEAFKWLVDNKYGDLIKNQVSTNFVRGQEEEARKFTTELVDRGLAVSSKTWVEPMTLKAFVKDQTEQGKNVPQDLFGLYIGEKATIVKPRGKK